MNLAPPRSTSPSAWAVKVWQGSARSRLGELFGPAMGWHVAALSWAAFVALGACLGTFRSFSHSSLAPLVDFADVPFLDAMQRGFGVIAWVQLAIGAALTALALVWWSTRPSPLRWGGALLCGCATLLGGYLARYRISEGVPEVAAPGLADWAWLALGVACALWLLRLRREGLEAPHRLGPPAERLSLAGLFLAGALVVAGMAWIEHTWLFDPERNGGYRYGRFFAPGERELARWVLATSSLCFASLAALLALGLGGLLRLAGGGPRALGRRAGLVALGLAATLSLPWLAKLETELRGEGSLLFPLQVLVSAFVALLPLLAFAASTLEEDARAAGLEQRELSEGESLLLASLTFPLYPLLRLLRPPRGARAALWTVALGLLAGLAWLTAELDGLMEFEDWRGMMKAGLFPALRVVVSLACAAALCLLGTRLARWIFPQPARARSLLVARGAAALLLVAASAPLWSWRDLPRNVHARLLEFSDRHEFERRFLTWLLDRDRDGYSWLGACDPDDGDPELQGAGLPPLAEVALPEDEFRIVDHERAARFPNLVVLTFEGVTPAAITAYGRRDLGRPATPHIDAVAARGARFTNAYCAYPSTWDGWFMLNAGRTLSIKEFDASQPFGDRYSRYNNLHKALRALGINRFCYPDVSPYVELFVPADEHPDLFEVEFEDEPSDAEAARGVTKGDKRTERLVRFIESVQPGDRFYLSEHTVDTHFPWEAVPSRRAHELGYPEGLSWAGADAYVDGDWIPRLSRYYQQVTRMDTQVGRVIDALRRQGLLDSTLVVLVSDHGCQWYEHEHCYYVSHLYEQSLRIPLIVAGPGVAPGAVIELPALQVDLVPTLVELGGLALADPSRPLEGRSLWPLLAGQPPNPTLRARLSERDLLLKTHYDTLGVLDDFRYKLVVDRPTGARWLFDLASDPGELINLIDSRPELEQRLLSRLSELARERAAFLGGLQRSEAAPGVKR